jgi:hypothetical protein
MDLLSQEEDDPIHMPPTSKKRRRQYAVLDDDSDDDDYPYAQPSSSLQADDEDKFVLPKQEDSSESEDEEPPHDYSSSEEDHLFQAAFRPKENRHANEPSLAQQDVVVVDLCGSDDDEHEGVSYSEGVRVPRASPRFNADSRNLFSPYKLPPRDTCNVDDIVECWSDEENSKPKARRVTDTHFEPSFSSSQRHSNAPRHDNARNDFASLRRNESRNESSMVARFPSSFQNDDNDDDDDDDDEPIFVPAPSRARTNVLERFRADKIDRRRRLRDATKTNTAAAVVLRNAPCEQASSNLWFRPGQAMAPSLSTRNDLTGGSGVGAGSYTLGQSFSNGPIDTASSAASSKGRKKKTTKLSTAKKAGGGKTKKKSWGGGRKKYYRKKGGKSSKKNGGGASWSSGRGSNEEYSRQDPLLKHVGGANIIF